LDFEFIIMRKICFIITSFIHYARSIFILEELAKNSGVDLHVVIGGTAVLGKYSSKYADIKKLLNEDGIRNIHEVHFNMEGDSVVSKAKTVGLGVIEFASFFNSLKPDLVVLRGDRFEVLAAAVAASNMNISIAHIEGGDVSGTLDESVRHAISKLAHIHFPTNPDAQRRIERMGEKKEYIFNFGCPEIEVIRKISSRKSDNVDFLKTGSGADFDVKKDFLMVMYHSVSTEIEKVGRNTRILLDAIHELGIQALWHWPNFDAGAEEISHEIRIFKDSVSDHRIKFTRYLPPRTFLAFLNMSKCLVGNSSASVKECSYLGVPAVNIGTRQNNRLRAENIIDAGENKEEIKQAIARQVEKGRYEPSTLYSASNTSKNIADTLANVDLYIQKSFCG